MSISCVREDLSGGESKEIGTAMPLFPLLVPLIGLSSADYRLKIHSKTLEGGEDIRNAVYLHDLSIIDCDMDSLILIVSQNERFEYHAFIFVEKCEYHIKMDK